MRLMNRAAEPSKRPWNWFSLSENTKLLRVIEDEEARKPASKRPAQRPCVTCRESFESTWVGNRMCPRCRAAT